MPRNLGYIKATVRQILKIFLMIGLFLSLFDFQAKAFENSLESLVHHGRVRTYKVHLPSRGLTERLPLVIVLHGFNGNADQAEEMSGMSWKADAENFIVVYPEGTEGPEERAYSWNAENCCAEAYYEGVDDIGFIRALIEKLSKDHPVDPERIYVTGFSNGGMMTYRLACMLSDKIAAIAPVSGSLNDADCSPTHPVSVLAFHGTADDRILYKGGVSPVDGVQKNYDPPVFYSIRFWASRDGAKLTDEKHLEGNDSIVRQEYLNPDTGAEVILITLIGGIHAWPDEGSGLNATDEIWEFFKHHKKIKDPR